MPLTIEQVNAQAAEIDARMQLPDSDPNHLSLTAGRSALINLADQLDATPPAGAAVVFYSGPFRDIGGETTTLSSREVGMGDTH